MAAHENKQMSTSQMTKDLILKFLTGGDIIFLNAKLT